MQKRHKLIAIVASSVVICLLIAIGIAYYYLYTPVSAKAETTYLYIDSDDDADSVYTKLQACCETQSLKGVKPMANYYDYQNNIRTGRYSNKFTSLSPDVALYKVRPSKALTNPLISP